MIGCCGFVSCAPVVSGLQLFSVFCLNMAALPLRLTPSPKLPALQVWSATKPSVKKLHAPSFPVVLTPAQRSSATARLNTPKRCMIFPIPPPILWARGDISLLNKPSIGMVGARNASSLGGRTARMLAAELSEQGHVIVSGLARGIDTSAHIASLELGTIAVLAGGVDVIYPSENAHLARDISLKGLLISEQPMGLAPQARHFPRRNRLISGLSIGLVVVEAAAKSGSLITARNALDQGREVLAVPGHPFDARASGCNMLIRDGATLVRSAADVLETLAPLAPDAPTPQSELSLNIPPPPPERRGLAETAALHQQILSRLGPSPLPEDQLIRDLAQPAATIGPVLIELELDGKISRAAGGMLTKEL